MSFFSCCLQRLFFFPPQKHGLQHNWDITFQFGLYRGVDVRTYGRTVARSRGNQNFSHRWVTTFSYQWCSARECLRRARSSAMRQAMIDLFGSHSEIKILIIIHLSFSFTILLEMFMILEKSGIARLHKHACPNGHKWPSGMYETTIYISCLNVLVDCHYNTPMHLPLKLIGVLTEWIGSLSTRTFQGDAAVIERLRLGRGLLRMTYRPRRAFLEREYEGKRVNPPYRPSPHRNPS